MNKNMSSMFDNCYETTSQEIYLQRCGFALQENPPDSDSVIASGYDVVETQAIRFVSPEPSTDTDTVDSAIDRKVPVESEVDSHGANERLDSPAKGKKVKVPLRDVVKAIVMNSKKTEEEEGKEIEKMSYVQFLVQKGFKFT
ncbi:hypothetical protein AALP_AA1G299100 [Arabis alpina]|uniref:Uncharacterized protein n=1 Tax=Arabis alpina TaxID=50452 RepID=A0A087HRK7_ARAAL|nr:hypothetical protein AALP_AA1G299100 [Arabis alpina]